MQAQKSTRRRRRQCLHCHQLFFPDPRTKGRQRYCIKAKCQTIRQRKNEKDWRNRNPDCLKYQRQLSLQWHKAHPNYSKQRRLENPRLLRQNRSQTRQRMRKIRSCKLFDKSKVILTQLAGNKSVKGYLTPGTKWLYLRLTKASPLSKAKAVWDNSGSHRQIVRSLPKERLYELSGILE